MNKKKVILTMALVLTMAFLFGCTKSAEGQLAQGNNEGQEEKLQVLTTVFAPYDFVRQIAGDQVELTMLVPPAAESHSYEPSPQDIIKIQNCDVFIYGGGESDEWVTDILKSVGNDNIKVIKMVDYVELFEEEIVEGMQDEEHAHDHEEEEHEEAHDHEEEEHEEAHDHEEEIEYDEHVWTSPKNAMLLVKVIKDTLVELDEINKEVYEANAAAYLLELEQLDADFWEVVDNGVRKEVIFADRFPLRYFVEAYGLKYYAAFPGCATDTEPSAATVAFLIDKVKEDEIPVVFHIELSNEKMADTICEATGAKKLLFNACHTISKTDFENGVTYLDIMQQNVETLREALN